MCVCLYAQVCIVLVKSMHVEKSAEESVKKNKKKRKKDMLCKLPIFFLIYLAF